MTNKGPDPTDSEISVGFVWQDSTSSAEFVSYDGPEPCTYVEGGFNGDPSYLNCTEAPAGFAVGDTMTFHVSLKWTSQSYTQFQGSVTAPTGDPDTNNNIQSLWVLSEPNPPDGGGDDGGGGPAAPTAPPYQFVDHLPEIPIDSYSTVPFLACTDGSQNCLTDAPSVTLTAGSLPAGVKMNGTVLYGVPYEPGTYTFTFQATYPAKNYTPVEKQFTLLVDPVRQISTGKAPPLLPNRVRTPGVINAVVTQETIKKTICVSGWTARVRPPVSYTNTLKLRQMKPYGEKGKPTAYEEDHLIPLELGGAPRNPRNLWPEPHSQSKHSDPLETALKRKVCAGKLTLAAARKQILSYKHRHG